MSSGGAAPAEVVRRLYTLPPGQFVAARTEAVAATRGSDPAAARAIGKLRKPTVAAWLVNLLALRRPDLIDGLVELSGQLRSAQRQLRGPALRELSTRRRAVIESLVAQARALAVDADPAAAAGKLPLAEVEATLSAALSDEQIAAQVRSGRLIRAVDYAGFGEVPRPRLRLVGPDDVVADEPDTGRAAAGRARRGRAAADRAERDRAAADRAARELADRRRRLTAELDQANAGQHAAQSDLARAAAAEHEAAEAVAEAHRQLAEWERRRAAAEQELARRKVARKTAERAVSAARRYVGDVTAVLEDLPEPG
ncbi:hypothetical protein O7623_26165 [Solwaraspora sp. WMMD791]|uniref:hypothetical protein n=1 Tax=Solwaraspora sp. WMMD791 TaxID=3016086 RepID=UPI00249C726F|nr:hypothetical protein [Solwaraspora sp. WMMD791]WFE26731.1 hypothetical protein O7623_26165 [Solwaraspora sp. WMMD791]